jgi:hypothetical protein
MSSGNGHDLGTTKVKEPRFKLVPFDQLRPSPEPAYLIKGLIPRVGLVVVWGPPKCGKSFWTTDAMLHVALGWEYRGRKVMQGPVVYCALEGQDGYGKRAEGFRQERLAEDAGPVPFYLVPARMSLVKDNAALIAAIKLQLGETKPVAVVIDTLNRSLDGSESKDEDMSAYVRAADAIREAFGCAVIIVHHCGVNGDRPRGHTALTGAADAQLAVERDAANNIVVTVEWMKDGPEGETVVSSLKLVEEVGLDAEGNKISSCVVVPVEGGATRSTSNRKLSDRQRLALEALANCDAVSAPPELKLPGGQRVIEVERWREELFARGVLDRSAKNPREDFRRVKNSLQARSLIGARNDFVWSAANG